MRKGHGGRDSSRNGEVAPRNRFSHARGYPVGFTPPARKRQEVNSGEGRFPSAPLEELGRKVGFKVSAAALGGKFSGLTLIVESQGDDCVLTAEASRPRQTKCGPSGQMLSLSSPVSVSRPLPGKYKILSSILSYLVSGFILHPQHST